MSSGFDQTQNAGTRQFPSVTAVRETKSQVPTTVQFRGLPNPVWQQLKPGPAGRFAQTFEVLKQSKGNSFSLYLSALSRQRGFAGSVRLSPKA